MSNDINLNAIQPLIPPSTLKTQLPLSSTIRTFVDHTRNEIKNILEKKDPRLLCIIGPCSIHNIEEAYEYGKALKEIANKVKDSMLIVMRVYFEKPRTTIGWKGLINDPYLDGSCDVNHGLFLARKLLIELNKIGVPCGYEILDTITPQYISDLISWGAIGARTTESQVHRQLISGMSMPVGFKNGTRGDIKMAADAVISAAYPHCFMGITEHGNAAICTTKGNKDCHIILRGGKEGPNYFPTDIARAEKVLDTSKLCPAIMVDCSHGNSGKDFRRQQRVMVNIINQAKENSNIIGIMMESNINEGSQPLIENIKLKYGISITDSCINIENTETYLLAAARVLQKKIDRV
jgi:3-deoxy-7-phosphoheptulonate synthase